MYEKIFEKHILLICILTTILTSELFFGKLKKLCQFKEFEIFKNT